MPLFVSIITPSFNQAVFLTDAIASVAAQGYPHLEHRVYDAGSTDGTSLVLERHRNEIIAFVGPDGGQAEAVNRGFREARGDILGWLNSDDLYLPGALQTVAEHFATHPECDVVYGGASYVDTAGHYVAAYPTGNPEDLRFGCFVCQPAVFLRRRVFETIGGLDESLRYCMDYDWWLRIGRRFRMYRIAEELAAYRLHPHSKSVAEQLEARREAVEVTRRQLGATPLTVLYGYANFLVRRRHGVALDDAVPLTPVQGAAALALTAGLALRYHPLLRRDDLRLLAARLGRGRALAPGDFSPAASGDGAHP